MKTLLIYIILIAPIFFIDLDYIEIDAADIPLVGLWVEFIVRILIYVVLSVAINYFFADDGADEPGPKSGVMQVPRVTASAPVPVLFGTKVIAQPNVVWYGDVKATPWEQCYG